MRKIFIYLLSIGLGLFVLIFLINALVIIIGRINIKTEINDIEKKPLGLVLGAGISEEGQMSLYLKDRADAAVSLYKAGLIENILISGDNSRSEYNEVEPVKEYLLKEGLFSGDIYLDHAGFDTYDSIIRTRDIFQSQNIIIITQSFHLPRAVFIASMLGMNVEGYASAGYRGSILNHIREVAARVKSFFEVVTFSEPYYRGENIIIE
jgi:SanA protein